MKKMTVLFSDADHLAAAVSGLDIPFSAYEEKDTILLDEFEGVTLYDYLEKVLSFCQNTDEPWCDPPCRSMTVGDLIRDESGNYYLIGILGFKEVTFP